MNVGSTKPKQATGIDRVMEAIDQYISEVMYFHEHISHDLSRGSTAEEKVTAINSTRAELRAALREYVEYER